ncbi:MAG: helix-turn-helix transcriptional regulator [Planctomycetaceae bacterium]
MRDAFADSTSSVAPAAPLLLSIKDAAAALSLSERSLWSLSAPRGPIPVTVLPGVRAVRYSVAALEAFIAAQQQSQA